MTLPLKKKKSFLLFLLLSLGNLILISMQVPRGEDQTLLKKALLTGLTPVQAAAVWIGRGVVNLWESYFHWRDISERNQNLREENFFLRQENTLLKNILQKLGEEVQIRQRLSPFYSSISSSIIVASVIATDAGNIYKSLVINRGSRHDIKPDMVVLDPQGNLLGRVINPVMEWTSRVQLLTDEASGVGAVTATKRVMGVLRGDGRGHCFLNYVLISSPEIKIGEEVLTSGMDKIYPAGLSIGRIISVKSEGSLFKKILVEPYFRLNGLVQVAVISFDLKNF